MPKLRTSPTSSSSWSAPWNSGQPFSMDGGKGLLEKLVGRDRPVLADVVLQKGEKAQLRAGQGLLLGEGCETHLNGYGIEPYNAAQDVGNRYRSVRKETAQRVQIDIRPARMHQTVELIELGVADRFAATDPAQYRIGFEHRFERRLDSLAEDAVIDRVDARGAIDDFEIGFIFLHIDDGCGAARRGRSFGQIHDVEQRKAHALQRSEAGRLPERVTAQFPQFSRPQSHRIQVHRQSVHPLHHLKPVRAGLIRA